MNAHQPSTPEIALWLSAPATARVDAKHPTTTAGPKTQLVVEVIGEHQFVLKRIAKTTLILVRVEPLGTEPPAKERKARTGAQKFKLSVGELLQRYNI